MRAFDERDIQYSTASSIFISSSCAPPMDINCLLCGIFCIDLALTEDIICTQIIVVHRGRTPKMGCDENLAPQHNVTCVALSSDSAVERRSGFHRNEPRPVGAERLTQRLRGTNPSTMLRITRSGAQRLKIVPRTVGLTTTTNHDEHSYP